MPVSPDKTPVIADKVTRYHWTIKNAPGEFLMVPKNELEIDHAYQRNNIKRKAGGKITRLKLTDIVTDAGTQVRVIAVIA